VALGSDWPVCLLAARGYDGWVSAVDVLLDALSADERARVMGTTARTLYRLAS
jgi:predicted TIM-barrel fold metal-dependent hydrolase